MMEFHISRNARDRYRVAETLFSLTGNVVFANLSASREFAYRMNQVRDTARYPERTVHAAALYTMGLIDEATHAVLASYRDQFDPAVMTDALTWFAGKVGAENLDKLLLKFVEHFPGVDVYRGQVTPSEWLAGVTDGSPHRAAALEEMMLLWMANHNPAFHPFQELFLDSDLAEKTAYAQVTANLPTYFATRPRIHINSADLLSEGSHFGLGDADRDQPEDSPLKRAAAQAAKDPTATIPVTIFELLRAPALAAPASLPRQLARIRRAWRPLLAASLQHGLAIAAEVLQEEERAVWRRFNPPSPGGDHGGHEAGWDNLDDWLRGRAGAEGSEKHLGSAEYEKFSADVAWMPTAVLLAKSTYVWLAQLTRQYGRPIYRLDHVPDEELDQFARRGMNSLWLIGVWERSRASQTIKQLCGNADAVASAYSLFDYNIAEDLGGQAAYENLRDRAYRRGIRLASDMVANHMGIDSPWVVEHPDWFLSRQHSPYPAYNFDGPDLSTDPRVEIKIEKHYYEQTDAAVVFRRVDRQSGEMRYIYHGNDGTSFPWNDTAQLDYMNAAVREQVIQTILRVARMFPVIRFDAAMTLAKRHFHRLWFPGPGSSGAIPSRAEYSMSDAEFNRVMPHEFWREVVDRVAVEVPGTLLLAEAFWLMESYFVRTLGMHRVYNSAFMVMLRDEDNANYRAVLKQTLEFDADIMKRYVNFMSNPDERTAIDQFGNGDKCFGVAALMSTLPGLPMFGHGQVEGYTEKYGMEYRRPRMEESPDPWLVDRHQREIAPLLHQRALFAESSNFRLYDFVRDDGSVEENVYAYSNRGGDGRAVVLYNNAYSSTYGKIDTSATYADKGSGEQRRQRLHHSLDFPNDPAIILAYRDSLTGLEYLRRSTEVAERGLGIHLRGYQCHVFLNWRDLRSTATKRWDRLCDQLNGGGIPDLENALVNFELQPTHDALRALLNPALLQDIAETGAPAAPAVATVAQVATTPLTVPSGKPAAKGSTEGPTPNAAKTSLTRDEIFEAVWRHCLPFFEKARPAYALLGGHQHAYSNVPPDSELRSDMRARFDAALKLPTLEALFPEPWSAQARAVLPTASQQQGPSAWATVVFWSALKVLAKTMDPAQPRAAALNIFDTLRLREPLAHSAAAIGLQGEESWRLAARMRILLLAEAGALEPVEASGPADKPAENLLDKPTSRSLDEPSAAADPNASASQHEPPSPGVNPTTPAPEPAYTTAGSPQSETVLVTKRLSLRSPALWDDSDVRWFTGLHEAAETSYFAKEPFEELVWWLQLPSLLTLASAPVADRIEIERLSSDVQDTLRASASAGYKMADFLKTKTSVPPPQKT